MRAIGLIIGAALCLAAGEASAQQSDEGYAAFEVTRSSPRRAAEVAAFDLAGAPVSVNAYGRKARARRFDSVEGTREDRLHAAAFDKAARPPLLTLEMRVNF